jgi:Protein of unknown function (DUF732)
MTGKPTRAVVTLINDTRTASLEGSPMYRPLVTLIGVAVALVTFAAPAQADAQGDYLNALAGQGFQINPETTQLYISAGNRACVDMRNGMSTADAKRDIATIPVPNQHGTLGSNAALVSMVVHTAQQTLCPDTQGRLIPKPGQ